MGTTYRVQVDVWEQSEAGAEYTYAFWQGVSHWELQKDYGFSMAWSEVADDGWPEGVVLITERPDPKDRYTFIDGKQHGDGALLELVDYEDPWPWFLELKAHVKSLCARGFKVRLLTWGT